MNKEIKITVDDTEIETREGENLLRVCLENKIYIPNLCYINNMKIPSSSCRLCLVEVQGKDTPLTACTLKTMENMVIKTNTETVRDLQRTALELILSTHDVDCLNCTANGKCDLQKLAGFLKVGLKREQFEKILKSTDTDQEHPLFDYLPNRCILCRKCVYICGEVNERSILSFAGRGIETAISFYGVDDFSFCSNCKACVDICPVDALIFKSIKS